MIQNKKSLKLSKQQREITTGLMLGDGHLETQDDGRTYRLKVEHSVNQLDYVEWLYGQYVHCGFRTYSIGSFRFHGKQFYKNKKKMIPTYSFSKPELKILQDALINNFDIQTTIQRQKDKYWRLYVLSDSALKLEKIILPQVKLLKSMSHKLVN